jgi:predicted nuclease of predicted toxin-antitoxin system
VRLLLDEHIDPQVAQQLRDRDRDVLAVQEQLGLCGMSDDLLLTLAAHERRVIVTKNIHDFVRIHHEWLARDQHHCGILLLHSRRYPDGPSAIGKLVTALDDRMRATEPADSYEFL